MRIDFEDDDLRRLYEESDFRLAQLGPDVTKAYRKRVQLIAAANDERDLYALRSNRFEKLGGDSQGQWSLRINDQWRLIVRLEKDDEGTLVVVSEVVDYH